MIWLDVFLTDRRLFGLAVGVCAFLIIGLFHPLVIRGEYRFGVRVWWAFLVLGLLAGAGAVLVRGLIVSTVLGVTAFASLWSIGEVFAQRRRVQKGWFPENPRRKAAQPKNR